MSTLSVTTLQSANATTDLTIKTGNTSGPSLVLLSNGTTVDVLGGGFPTLSIEGTGTTQYAGGYLNLIATGANANVGGTKILHVLDTGAGDLSDTSFQIQQVNTTAGFVNVQYLIDYKNATQTWSTGGTNRMSLSANGLSVVNNVTATNFSGFGIGQGSNVQVITTTGPGSWTVPAGVLRWKVTIVGAGGQGGGTAAVAGHIGNGGGSGGVVIGYYDFVTGQTSMSYNVGTGGTGGTTTGTGGTGGASNTTYNAVSYNAVGGGGGANSATATVGSGGTATGGSINLNGANGGAGGVAAATNPVTGSGAHTRLGFGDGGIIPLAATGATGTAGSGYGSGGSGGKNGSGTTARAGGAGAQGLIIIEW